MADSGYEPSQADLDYMTNYYAARDAGMDAGQAQQAAMSNLMQSTYAATPTAVDTAGLTAEAPNWAGTPTLYSNDQGVQGVLSQNGVVTPQSMNVLAKPGERITANTPVQAVNEDGLRLYLRDPNDPESRTTEITGIPAIAGTLGSAAYAPARNRGVLGTIGGDFLEAAKDPAFHKFLAAAAAITGGGLALNSAYGVGGLGAGTVASPVSLGGTIPATELGAVGTGGGGYAGMGAGEFIAADAAASAAGQGAFDLAASLGMPLDQAVTSGLITGGGALTDAGAAALLGSAGAGVGGLGGLSGQQLFQAARMALPVAGSILGGGKAGQSGQGGQGGQGGTTTQVSATGPWNTFLTPTMIRQDIVEQKPIMDNPQLATIYGSLDPYLGNQLAQAGMIPANLGGSNIGGTIANVPSANYYSYGSLPQTDLTAYGQSLLGGSPLMVAKGGGISDENFRKTAMGGNTQALFEQAKKLLNPTADVSALAGFKDGGQEHVPEFITGATGHYVKGRGDGQSDDIPAMLADGEYVFDADTVAQLGNGSSDAGAKVLDKMRQAIRAHKRSADVDEIPPKAKSPLEYLKEGMKRK